MESCVSGLSRLPDNPYGNPIAFFANGRQHLVVAVGGGPYMTGLDLIAYEDTVVSKEVHQTLREARNSATSTKAELLVFRLPN